MSLALTEPQGVNVIAKVIRDFRLDIECEDGPQARDGDCNGHRLAQMRALKPLHGHAVLYH